MGAQRFFYRLRKSLSRQVLCGIGKHCSIVYWADSRAANKRNGKTNLIEFKNVTKSYPLEHGKRKVIFENISFAFPEGKNIALLGGNGAGKSTTLRLIAGSDFPDSGHIFCKT